MKTIRLAWKSNCNLPYDEVFEWLAYNEKGEHIGLLHYENVGRHMHWCWYQVQGIRMSPGCLQEVRDKQKQLLNSPKKPKRC